jgi:predicted metal-dependent phosphoesterase TrpH
MPGYDLHSHTIFSDGTTSPEHNLDLAVELGLEGLGVTDHDTAAHIGPFEELAQDRDIEIVPGTEFSAELGERSVHVLGYWFDPQNEALAAEMDRVRNERERRAEEIVAKFNALGIGITYERVSELAGNAPVGRPHIARAVVELGAARDTTDVFDRWLADGGPAYVPKYAVDPVRAVELVLGAGGVAVVAHPGLYGGQEGGLDPDTIEAMAGAGMAGIEADHPDHAPEVAARYRDLARALGLVVTAGSDFHGSNKDLPLGAATTAREVVEQLRARRS